MGKPINEEVVLEHWNDALRLTASIKTVSVKPSAMLRKLGVYRQQNRLYLALGEIGRIERTLFMLDWMESPQLRMECQAGSHDAQQKRVMALNLVIACTNADQRYQAIQLQDVVEDPQRWPPGSVPTPPPALQGRH